MNIVIFSRTESCSIWACVGFREFIFQFRFLFNMIDVMQKDAVTSELSVFISVVGSSFTFEAPVRAI